MEMSTHLRASVYTSVCMFVCVLVESCGGMMQQHGSHILLHLIASKYVGKYRQSGSAGGAHVFSFSIQNYSNDIIRTVQSTFTGKHHFLFRHDCALWKKQTPQRNVFCVEVFN